MSPAAIAFHKGYRLSDDGLTLKNPNGRTVVQCPNPGGYMRFTIINGGKRHTVSVHRLQAVQKFGEAVDAPGVEVRHLDGNQKNNAAYNIGLGSHSQNMMDKPADVRRRAALVATAKVRKYNPDEVRSFYEVCGSYSKTMNRFGISSTGTLHFILNKSCGVNLQLKNTNGGFVPAEN